MKGHAEELLGQTLESLRADLATALAGGADVVAQRDTALGLCKQRERELAAVTDGLHKSMDRVTTLSRQLAAVTAEREEAKAARERLDQDWKRRHVAWLEQQAREVAAHAETRKALEVAAQQVADVAGRSANDLESTRTEQAKAEARVKELERIVELHEAVQRIRPRG